MKVQMTTSELKESLLIINAVIWASILLFPGDSFASRSRIDLMSLYAPDVIWGSLLLIVCLPILFMNRQKNSFYRKVVHAFLWTFWFGVAILAVWRSSENGMDPVDFLISLPFVTIALLHGIIYAGLGRKV